MLLLTTKITLAILLFECSGMLPGFVSGFYSYDDCHIDLARLSAFSKARLVNAEAVGLDIQKRQVLFKSRPPVRYDALSIDIGITPGRSQVPGAADLTTPVKPIDKCVPWVLVQL